MKKPFTSQYELRKAVESYFALDGDRAKVVKTYGRVSSWNIDAVTDLSRVFHHIVAPEFDLRLTRWRTRQVDTLDRMFQKSVFRSIHLEGWDVSQVVHLSQCFEYCHANIYLDGWQPSSVIILCRTFAYSTFNQPIDHWDVRHVYNMCEMFRGNKVFNQPLSSWDVGKVRVTYCMFYQASAFNQPLFRGNFDELEDMQKMMEEATSFNQSVAHWHLPKVYNATRCFAKCRRFNQSLHTLRFKHIHTCDQFLWRATDFHQRLPQLRIGSWMTMGPRSLQNQSVLGTRLWKEAKRRNWEGSLDALWWCSSTEEAFWCVVNQRDRSQRCALLDDVPSDVWYVIFKEWLQFYHTPRYVF